MALDTSGNQTVDFAWGNIPMQPNDDRNVKLGSGNSHAINGSSWNSYPELNYLGMDGHTLEGGSAFYWPSIGISYNNPKTKDNNWKDLIEYMRACGVNQNRLREATFVGGDNQYDTDGEYDGGIIFWDYIPADTIIWFDQATGYTLTGKDFDGHVIAANHSAGDEVSVDPENDLDLSFVAFTNDPNKNTAGWWY